MRNSDPTPFISLLGKSAWRERVQAISDRINKPTRTSKRAASRFAAECAIEKARRGLALNPTESALVNLATRIPALHETLTAAGKNRLGEMLETALTGNANLIPMLHLLHTARLHNARGFDIAYTGFNEATAFDLLASRDGACAEIACDTISAEDGHALHGGAWSLLADRLDPDLQTWLAAHPGRYLLKMTLPKGLKPEADNLPVLQTRIKNMLSTANRADYDEAAMLRLDPLLLAGAQATDRPLAANSVIARLRREFGPEAHFAITETGNSLFIMAARAGMENQVAVAVRQRLAAIAPARLSGDNPGILSMFIEDAGPLEWQILCGQLLLEGEARNFLTFPEARPVIAVTCASRYELAGAGAPGGDVRFRNPMHPAAKSLALAPAILSTV